MMKNTDFVSRFHNIEGDLISERKRNFFKLLRENTETLNEEVLNNLSPKTYLESLFQIEIFIYVKKTAKLLETLKGGNEIFISKILKQSWFFKEAFKDIGAEELVDDFLPYMSFAMRMRVLKKVSATLEEAKIDEVFDCVLKRYGIYTARRMLHTCSGKKIKEALTAHEVILEPNQVQAIFNKDVELFEIYLEHYKKITLRKYYDTNVLKYIAVKNPEFWVRLLKTKKIKYCKLGRRLSKKIIDIVKTDIINDTSYYSDFLAKDVLVRKLHGNFKDVYFMHFPQNMQHLSMTNFCNVLLRYFPKKRQWYMFSETFSRVFTNETILDNLIYIDHLFLRIFPNKDIMHKWAESHYKVKNDHYLWKYFDVNKGIPLIKEKINVTSDIHERSNLVILLLEICAKNEDLKSLEGVLKHICFRHRNEDTAFRNKLLSNISNLFNLDRLNENHWKYINEQITLLRLRNEFSFHRNIILIRKYLEYLFLNGKPFKNEIIQFCTETISTHNSFRISSDNPIIEKEILTEIAKISIDIIESLEGDNKNTHCSNLIKGIANFSIHNPEFCINLADFPKLVAHVEFVFNEAKDISLIDQILTYNKKFPDKAIIIEDCTILNIILNNKNINILPILVKFIKKQNRSAFENEVVKIFWNNFFVVDDIYVNITTWFFYNEPQTIAPYFDKILEKSLSRKITFFDKGDIRLMSHFSFDTKMIEFYIKELDNVDYIVKKTLQGVCLIQEEDDDVSKFYSQRWLSNYYYLKENIIRRLSLVMTTEDFINIVAERFLPEKEKLNLDEKEIMEVYKLQCEVATCLKRLSNPVKGLPTVMKFCLGDYLQSTLTSLYSTFYRSPEKYLYSYVDVLLKGAVSTRKHAVFLSCELLSLNFVKKVLSSLRYNNVSSQKHLFSATLKYFLKNPSEELLDLVILNLNTIDKNDKETLDSLISINIPKKFEVVYIEKCWKFFEDMKEKEVPIKNYLTSVLKSLMYSGVLVSLSKGFCEHVINNYFREVKEELDDINLFACKFLEQRKMEQEENFNYIFEIVATFKKHNCKSFFSAFYEITTDTVNNNRKDECNHKFMQLFKQNWERIFPFPLMFDEHVLLKLLILKCESVDPFVENYAQHVVIFLKELVSKFGPYIYGKFKGLLEHTLNFSTIKEMYLFYYYILKFKITSLNCILVLDLMESYDDTLGETKSIYNNILDILKNVNDPVVVVCYNSYLDKNTSIFSYK